MSNFLRCNCHRTSHVYLVMIGANHATQLKWNKNPQLSHLTILAFSSYAASLALRESVNECAKFFQFSTKHDIFRLGKEPLVLRPCELQDHKCQTSLDVINSDFRRTILNLFDIGTFCYDIHNRRFTCNT